MGNLRNDNLIFAKYLVVIELYKEVYDLKQKKWVSGAVSHPFSVITSC